MQSKTWNPYIAGALTGLLLILSVLIAGKYLGASTTFARSAAVIEKTVGVDTSGIEYFNWQLLFVVGVIVGSLISASSSKTFEIVKVPPMWAESFGDSQVKRGVAAFIGGAIALFGVRLAGGCPSGHGLSGLAQLAVSGFIAMTFFFLAGLITARLMYKK